MQYQTFRPKVWFCLPIVLSISFCMPGQVSAQWAPSTPQLPIPSEAIFNDPVFTPSTIGDTYHMTPVIFYGGNILRPGEFDFDMMFGTYGSNFKLEEEGTLLMENSQTSFFGDLGWRFGVSDGLGPLQIPVEFYVQFPLYGNTGGLKSYKRVDQGEGQTSSDRFVNEDDDEWLMGKWILGSRFGLVSETDVIPALVLQLSTGLPVDDRQVSDGVDFDFRLLTEKHLPAGFVTTLYGGILHTAAGRKVLNDAGADGENTVPYVGFLAQCNLSQLFGRNQQGPVWIQGGVTWRDALYEFGSRGPSYASEQFKGSLGMTFDLGWWGYPLGRPQGMVGMTHTFQGGPEDGELEFVSQLRFPFKFD